MIDDNVELKKREDFSEAVIRKRRREKRSDTSATQSFKSLGVVAAMYCTYTRMYRLTVSAALIRLGVGTRRGKKDAYLRSMKFNYDL